MQRKMTVLQLCLIAMAVCVNVAGGQIALLLRLPVYLDSIGTLMTGILMGPVYGMIPNLLSGVLLGLTTDIYSLYFAPVGMLVGLMAGLTRRLIWNPQPDAGRRDTVRRILPAAVLITVPGTIASSLICAKLFGGITSSGSTVLVQLLAKTSLGMTASVFIVQVLTDYLDRVISLFAVMTVLRALPLELRQKWSGQR